MGIKTKIEWADSSINPIMGCTGCALRKSHCYAAALCARYAGRKGWPLAFDQPEFFPGRLEQAMKWSDLTGKIRPDEPWLDGLPRHIFVNDLSDGFCPDADPWHWLAPSIPSMHLSSHIWMLLTKWPDRMCKFFEEWNGPIPSNFHLGVSVENQAAADERIPWLLQTPAAVRFVSVEPLLGPVDISPYLDYNIHMEVRHDEKRGRTVHLGGERRVEDRRDGTCMEDISRRVDQSRTSDTARLSSSEKDEEWHTTAHRGAPLGMDTLQWVNTGRHGDQSQEWNQRQQSSQEFGDRDSIQEHAPCLLDRAETAVGRDESSGEVDGCAGRGNQEYICCREYHSSISGRPVQCVIPDHIEDCKRRTAKETERANRGLHTDASKVYQEKRTRPIHQVIVGGESGPGARPMHPDWARSLRDRCQVAGVPFFFTQWGAWAPCYEAGEGWLCLTHHAGNEIAARISNEAQLLENQWDETLMARVGKKRAGHLLDGRTWQEFPVIAGALT